MVGIEQTAQQGDKATKMQKSYWERKRVFNEERRWQGRKKLEWSF